MIVQNIMLFFNLFLIFIHSNQHDSDFIMLFSANYMNSATEMCSLFPTRGYICSFFPLKTVNWMLPSKCQEIANYYNDSQHSNTIEFTCLNSEIPYQFSLWAENANHEIFNKTILLKFEKCPVFRWYTFSKDQTSTGRLIKNGSEILIWPISIAESTELENKHLATFPDEISQEYAISMKETQSSPVVSLLSTDGSSVDFAWNTDIVFNSSFNCWITKIFFREYSDFNIQIESKDRFQANEPIDSTLEYFYPLSVNFSSIFLSEHFRAKRYLKSLNIKHIPRLRIRRHPCIQGSAFVRINDFVLTTNDDFDSYDVFKVKNLNQIDSIILTTTGFNWLSNSIACQINYITSEMTSSKLPTKVTFLKALFSWNTLLETEDFVDIGKIVIAANKNEPTDHFYFTIDGWKSYEKVSFNKTVSILDMEVVANGQGMIVFYYMIKNEHYTRTFYFENYPNKTFNGIFGPQTSFAESGLNKADLSSENRLVSNSIGQVFFVGRGIFISTDEATTFLPLRMISLPDQEYESMPNSTVRDIVFSRSCKCALIYETGEIFILYPNQNYFVQMQMFGGKTGYIRYDNLDRVALINFRENNKELIRKHHLLIENEIGLFGQIFKEKVTIECPYIQFDIQFPTNGLAYIDKNTEIRTMATIISERSDLIRPLIRSTHDIAISTKIENAKTARYDVIEKKYTAMRKIEAEINVTGISRGVSYLLVSPNGATYQCGNAQKILNVYVGCPRGRHIRIKGGDNIRLFYSKTRFKPELELWDNDKFIEDVKNNFVLYLYQKTPDIEVKYCQTAASVGCKRKPQSWKDFISDNQSISPWNQTNYQSCFEEGNDFDPNEYYNIMNSTEKSCIVLMPKNRQYKFRATIVDPNYSYCFLSTEFNVTVHGEPLHFGYSIGLIVFVLEISIMAIYSIHQIHVRNFEFTNQLT